MKKFFCFETEGLSSSNQIMTFLQNQSIPVSLKDNMIYTNTKENAVKAERMVLDYLLH